MGRRAARMLISEAPIRSAIWAVLTPASLSERASIRRARCCRLLRASARCDTPPSFPLAIGYPWTAAGNPAKYSSAAPYHFVFAMYLIERRVLARVASWAALQSQAYQWVAV